MDKILEVNQLRRAVAEALGWRLVRHHDMFGGGWYLYTPSSDSNDDTDWLYRIPVLLVDYDISQSVWVHILNHTKHIPGYATDLNTIKGAPLDEDVSVEINNPLPHDTKRQWDVSIYTDTGDRYTASHHEPATAFWNAWLLMRKAVRNE